MLLSEHTTTTPATAFDTAEVAVLLVGSTEQHGRALPLGTDFMLAESFARTLSDPDDVTVLPTLPVGVSEHHRQFHGTLSVRPETFGNYVAETIESAASHGMQKTIIVNGHGGNVDALERAARNLRAEETAFAPTWNWWESGPELSEELFETEGGHAGPAETSLVLEVAQSTVREAAIEEAGEGASTARGESVHGASVGFDTIDFTSTGAVGDPEEGSREEGTQLFEAAEDDLAALAGWLADQPFESLLPGGHV